MGYPIAIVGIDYDEPNPATYRGVTLTVGKKRVVFATGDPSADYAAACEGAALNVIYCSSSVDHFLMDGGRLAERGQP